jgi:B12-binding domain/radical SAM domain protein of rhizo-twelve system
VRVALVNPPWSFEGSVYSGCREPHLPIEYGFAKALLERAGHVAQIIDAQMDELSYEDVSERIDAFSPDMTVVTTAPSYLSWRCAPPELRVAQETLDALAHAPGAKVAVGPHASTTPRAAMRKLGVDAAVVGECEERLVALASTPRSRWRDVSSIAYRDGAEIVVTGAPHAVDVTSLPAIRWPVPTIARHHHQHNGFEDSDDAPGAEIEYARGGPDRKRPLAIVLDELDALLAQGVRYVYFIDEIFPPDVPLLEALRDRDVRFGAQVRIDDWTRPMLDLLGEAGSVSLEAGMESISDETRSLRAQIQKASTVELTALLVYAKSRVPFVQATLTRSAHDDPDEVRAWRDHLRDHGVWSNAPAPLFPYPGSPEYTQRWGTPDDEAWERAHEHYLEKLARFSDIEEMRPLPLRAIEHPSHGATHG